MKKSVWFILPFVLLPHCYVLGQQHPASDLNLWNVMFQDNFLTFTPARWLKCNNAIHGDEPQIYMDSNVYIVDGKLVLKTEQTDIPVLKDGRPYYYTSGQIMAKSTYKYGYFEIKAKLPISSGYWPAFWFWGENNNTSNPWYNEIDIFEADGAVPNRVTCAMSYSFNYPLMDSWSGVDTSYGVQNINDYHWYGVEWDRDKIVWYYDREPVIRLRNDIQDANIQHAMTMIANAALFPTSNEDGSDILPSTIFPNYMYIDDINAFQLDCVDKNVEVYDIADFSLYNYKLKKSITLSSATALPYGTDIQLYATDYILLDNGFTVPIGYEFYADTKPGCE